MGYWKERELEQAQLAYTFHDVHWVCPDCVSDEVLRRLLSDESEEEPCSYCGRARGAPFETLLGILSDAIQWEYTDPANELPYESREGGYQGTVRDGAEIIAELDYWTDNDKLLNDAADAFGGSAWCERDYFSLNKYDSLRLGWKTFVDQVKHHTRYLFLQELGDNKRPQDEEIAPGRMLDALGDLFREFELWTLLPANTEVIRARVHDRTAVLTTVDDLGPPPEDKATMPNRMSPAGIPMFYGAFDARTAIAETFDDSRENGKVVTLATFVANRELLMLDLTELPPTPSIFDADSRHRRYPIRFLKDFERDLTRPIARDETAHVEYVPTQVVTEFVRHRLHIADAESPAGVIYKSSQPSGRQAVVFFGGPWLCGPREDRQPWEDEPVLMLRDCEVHDQLE